MRTHTLFLIALFTLAGIHLKAQGLAESVQLMKLKKADRYFEEYSYSKAVVIYKELYIGGDSSLTSTIANCYFKLGLTDSASEWYSKVVQYTNPPVEDIFNYSEVLSQQGLYKESAKWLKAYRDLNTEDSRPNRKLEGNADPASLLENVNAFEITHLDINTREADFAAVPWNDRVVFTSSRRKTEAVKREYNWDQNPFLDLYSAQRGEDGSLSDVQKLDKGIETPFHQGPAAFTGDGHCVWFTRNNPSFKKGKGENDILHLALYSARVTNTKLEDIQPFSYNDAAYSVGQASVSEDGETLYFVSDMEGGYGGTDIYRSTMNDSGHWSTPENLGEFINTEGNEMFPYFHSSGLLFFSSNGHQGLGGLDVYKVHLENHPQEIDNLNAPINSSKDDFAFVIDKEFGQGYFSSNRAGGYGNDDIYAFTLGRPFMETRGLKGVLSDSDSDSSEIITMAQVTIRDEGANMLSDTTTDSARPSIFDADTVHVSEPSVVQNAYSLRTNDLNTNEASIVDSFKTEGLLIKKSKVELTDSITNIKSSQALEGLISPKKTHASANELLTRTTAALKETIKTLEDTNEDLIEPPLTSYNYANISPLVDFEVGMDLGELLNINFIYFDLNKYDIRPDARIELMKVVAVMLKHPDLTIELGSHTDCRGSKAYNQKLSESRANATAEYLRKHIDNAGRVIIKGYGESQPVNDCKCETVIDTDCSEEQHQANRRTEFKLRSIN